MVLRSLLALMVALVFADAAAARKGIEQGRVALLPLAGGERANEDVLRLEGALRASIEATTGRPIESLASTRELIESAKNLGVDCGSSDLECLLKLAILVEIDTLLVPSISLREDAFKLDLVLIDPASKSVKRAVQRTISPRSESFGRDVEGVAVELLAPERFVGALLVKAPVLGAEVKVNGQVVGYTPLDAIEGLAVGPHLVVVSAAGASPWAQLVDVRYRGTLELEATLEGAFGPALLGSRTVWFSSGLSLLALGGSVALLSGAGALAADVYLGGESGKYAEREAVKNTGVVLLVTSLATAVVAAAGGTLLLLALLE
jgi:hypothetical protein